MSNQKKVQAAMTEKLLKVTLPKAEPTKPRDIKKKLKLTDTIHNSLFQANANLIIRSATKAR